MKTQPDYGLNRIIKPDLSLGDFIRFAASCSARYVEIRNDLPDPSLLGGETPGAINAVCRETGVSILAVNALQRFNDPELRRAKKDELREMMATAASVGCSRIVLCPVNDPRDSRSAEERHRDLTAALRDYAGLFEEFGMIGLVEPLGFSISSLRLKTQAVAGIAESGRPDLYRVVHDTFHHHVSGETEYFPKETGLIHASGVPGSRAAAEMTDHDRVLVDEHDGMGNRVQLAALRSGGCSAKLSFEPFCAELGHMDMDQLREQIKESLTWILAEAVR